MGVQLPSEPINRHEQYLAKIAGQAVDIPAEPITREEAYLDYIAKHGGGGGGTGDYDNLENRPKVNNITLTGNKSASDLGLASASSLANKVDKVAGKDLSSNDYSDTEKQKNADNATAISAIKDGATIDSFADVESALSNKQDTLTFDDVPTANSNNPVKSGGVKSAIDAAVASAYHHAGTKTCAELVAGLLVAWNEGNVYNMTDSGTTTADFIEGQGQPIKAGDNVGIAKISDGVYKFDLLSGFVDTSNFVQKSVTAGLLKNDGTVNTTIEGDVATLKSGLANVSSDIEELQAYTGYSSTDIIGIEVDYVNKSFRRLGVAVGKNGGSDFDAFPMFGGRRRCNVADDGTISKYYGDTGYAEDGSNGQVMVYQPKFYYKVVPLKLEKQSTGKGYHIRKAAYYVTATPMKGFKVHPAFVNASGNEVDYILVGASKGCIYDVSESTYILDDAQVMDNTADKFSSIFGVKPASGLTQDLTRPKIEQMCQNRGANWHELNVQMASMTQLLMLIEYGKFDMQRAIGKGVVDITDNSSYNCAATSGSTSALGNASGRATSTTIVTNTSTTYTDDGKTSVTYRGEEDPYGDMWEFVMGMNIYGNGSMNGGEPYICSDYNYAESKNTDNYKGAGFTVANSTGYVNAWGYGSEDFDWLFIASEVGGSDALPVGDYLWKTANLNGYRIALMGAYWADAWSAGGFSWHLRNGVGYRHRAIAGRLAYIPA